MHNPLATVPLGELLVEDGQVPLAILVDRFHQRDVRATGTPPPPAKTDPLRRFVGAAADTQPGDVALPESEYYVL